MADPSAVRAPGAEAPAERYILVRAALGAALAAAAAVPVAVAGARFGGEGGSADLSAVFPFLGALYGLPALLALRAERRGETRPDAWRAFLARLAPLFFVLLACFVLVFPYAGATSFLYALALAQAGLILFSYVPRVHVLTYLNAALMVAGANVLTEDAKYASAAFLFVLGPTLAFRHFEERKARHPLKVPDDLGTPARIGVVAGTALVAVFAIANGLLPDRPRTDLDPELGPPPLQTAPGAASPIPWGPILKLVLLLGLLLLALYVYHRLARRPQDGSETGPDEDQVLLGSPEPLPERTSPAPSAEPSSVRERVVAAYLRYCQDLKRQGLPRGPADGASDHAARILERHASLGGDALAIARIFERARYGPDEPTPGAAKELTTHARRVLDRLEARRAPEGSP